MFKSTVIRHFGGTSKAARALGLTRQAVSKWGAILPEGAAYKVQVKTNGTLKVDPSVYEKTPEGG